MLGGKKVALRAALSESEAPNTEKKKTRIMGDLKLAESSFMPCLFIVC